jgi:hypothetical protein
MSPTRLLLFLTIFAVLFSPVSTIGGHAAMALPAPSALTMDQMQMTAPAGHCADMDEDSKDRSDPDINCMIACSAIPAADFQVDMHPNLVSLVPPARLSSGLRGLHPGSDPPPPRLS